MTSWRSAGRPCTGSPGRASWRRPECAACSGSDARPSLTSWLPPGDQSCRRGSHNSGAGRARAGCRPMRGSYGSGSIEQRTLKDGRVTWRAHWFDAMGKKQSASFDTQGEAPRRSLATAWQRSATAGRGPWRARVPHSPSGGSAGRLGGRLACSPPGVRKARRSAG
jgi:hypothetical protein